MIPLVLTTTKAFREIVVSFAGLCVIGVTAFVAYERFGNGQGGEISSYCNVSRLQGGKCQFTVEDNTSGRQCVEVSLTNKYNSNLKSSSIVCSGLIGPMETKNVGYSMDVDTPCPNSWDECEFDVTTKEVM